MATTLDCVYCELPITSDEYAGYERHISNECPKRPISRQEFEVMAKQVRETHLFITGVKAALLANPMVRAMVPADVLKELSGE